MSATTVDLEYPQKGIAVVTLDGPLRLNAIGRSTFVELHRSLDAIEADASARVICLTGTGDKAFCAGADINDIVEMDAVAFRAFGQQTIDTVKRLSTLGQIVVSAVNGIAYGAGCALVMGSDLAVATRSARFAQPEINVGIVGGAALLPRRLGNNAKAAEMVLLGRSIDADQAMSFGLVNEVVDGSALPAAFRLADALLEKPAGALVLAKQALVRGQAEPDEFAAFAVQQDLAALSRTLDESIAAAAGFVKHRRQERP